MAHVEARRHGLQGAANVLQRVAVLLVMRSAGALVLGLTVGTGCGWTRDPPPPVRGLEAGTGSRSLVLLHGFSSSPQEWMPFTATIRAPAGRRFVFPEGREAGVNGRGRAWWALDLASHMASDGLPDLSTTRPAGLEAAARSVRALLRDYRRREGDGGGDVVLGGFSQGAMVSAEIAFRSDEPLRALVLLSPTIVDEPSWRTGIAARVDMPVFIAHGRTDTILPFHASSRLARILAEAGLQVTWIPFDGGHDIPADVVTALNRFLETHAR